MDQKHNKMMADLNRLLKDKQFESKEELDAFLKELMGAPIPETPLEELSDKEKAEDLVFEAWELPAGQGIKNAKKALQLDPDCIAAYEFLASVQRDLISAKVYYSKGVETGRRLFGGDFLAENKGAFWGLHETRPFMRCMFQYSDCLYAEGKVRAAKDILEEMIELNPNDNQGVRDVLMLYLIELHEYEKFEKYSRQYKNDTMASHLFNKALYSYIRYGKGGVATRALNKAKERNPYVIPKLLAPFYDGPIPEYYGIGDNNEAIHYILIAHETWWKIGGAIAWLRETVQGN